MTQHDSEAVDMVLVGAGIMSATLAVLLKELDPDIKLEIVELQESGAVESSNPWNNAGTGHAGLCELNYTPDNKNGPIDIKKAVTINTQFEVSKQFWAYLAGREGFGNPREFLNAVPHLSFVRGSKNIDFLKRRFDALKTHHAFEDMVYTEDRATMAEWMPLMMPGRDADEPIAATRAMNGTDVNFGELTRQMLVYLAAKPGVKMSYFQKVTGLQRNGKGW
ncbi:malate:quinone oxidoreductase, partial [Stutzerimonas xanthomarina]